MSVSEYTVSDEAYREANAEQIPIWKQVIIQVGFKSYNTRRTTDKFSYDYNMLKSITALSLLGLTAGTYHQYQYNHSFRSVCNLVYAGTNMAYIYKYHSQSIE